MVLPKTYVWMVEPPFATYENQHKEILRRGFIRDVTIPHIPQASQAHASKKADLYVIIYEIFTCWLTWCPRINLWFSRDVSLMHMFDELVIFWNVFVGKSYTRSNQYPTITSRVHSTILTTFVCVQEHTKIVVGDEKSFLICTIGNEVRPPTMSSWNSLVLNGRLTSS